MDIKNETIYGDDETDSSEDDQREEEESESSEESDDTSATSSSSAASTSKVAATATRVHPPAPHPTIAANTTVRQLPKCAAIGRGCDTYETPSRQSMPNRDSNKNNNDTEDETASTSYTTSSFSASNATSSLTIVEAFPQAVTTASAAASQKFLASDDASSKSDSSSMSAGPPATERGTSTSESSINIGIYKNQPCTQNPNAHLGFVPPQPRVVPVAMLHNPVSLHTGGQPRRVNDLPQLSAPIASESERPNCYLRSEKGSLEKKHARVVRARDHLRFVCQTLQQMIRELRLENMAMERVAEEECGSRERIREECRKEAEKLTNENNEQIERLTSEKTALVERLMKENAESVERLEREKESAVERLKVKNEEMESRWRNENKKVMSELRNMREKAKKLKATVEATQAEARVRSALMLETKAEHDKEVARLREEKDILQSEVLAAAAQCANQHDELATKRRQLEECNAALQACRKEEHYRRDEAEKYRVALDKAKKEADSCNQLWNKSHQTLLEANLKQQEQRDELQEAGKKIIVQKALCKKLEDDRRSMKKMIRKLKTANQNSRCDVKKDAAASDYRPEVKPRTGDSIGKVATDAESVCHTVTSYGDMDAAIAAVKRAAANLLPGGETLLAESLESLMSTLRTNGYMSGSKFPREHSNVPDMWGAHNMDTFVVVHVSHVDIEPALCNSAAIARSINNLTFVVNETYEIFGDRTDGGRVVEENTNSQNNILKTFTFCHVHDVDIPPQRPVRFRSKGRVRSSDVNESASPETINVQQRSPAESFPLATTPNKRRLTSEMIIPKNNSAIRTFTPREHHNQQQCIASEPPIPTKRTTRPAEQTIPHRTPTDTPGTGKASSRKAQSDDRRTGSFGQPIAQRRSIFRPTTTQNATRPVTAPAEERLLSIVGNRSRSPSPTRRLITAPGPMSSQTIAECPEFMTMSLQIDRADGEESRCQIDENSLTAAELQIDYAHRKLVEKDGSGIFLSHIKYSSRALKQPQWDAGSGLPAVDEPQSSGADHLDTNNIAGNSCPIVVVDHDQYQLVSEVSPTSWDFLERRRKRRPSHEAAATAAADLRHKTACFQRETGDWCAVRMCSSLSSTTIVAPGDGKCFYPRNSVSAKHIDWTSLDHCSGTVPPPPTPSSLPLPAPPPSSCPQKCTTTGSNANLLRGLQSKEWFLLERDEREGERVGEVKSKIAIIGHIRWLVLERCDISATDTCIADTADQSAFELYNHDDQGVAVTGVCEEGVVDESEVFGNGGTSTSSKYPYYDSHSTLVRETAELKKVKPKRSKLRSFMYKFF